MCVTGHQIDENWAFCSLSLDFKQFTTPYTEDAAETGIKLVLEEWDIVDKVYSVKTENERDIIKVIYVINEWIYPNYVCDSSYLAHIISLGVNDCVSIVHREVSSIRSLINSS